VSEKSLRTNDSIDQTVEKYSDMVYRLAFAQTKSKCDADDIFQEVFLRYMKADAFENEEHEKAWLIRVTVNCCKRFWSSAWHRHTVPLQEELPFEMSALPYTSHEIENAKNAVSLPESDTVVVGLFLQKCGVGGDDSWGAPVHEEYLLKINKDTRFTVALSML
jgi:RNA polymerase sigma-70 factor (ECF subfamily)